MNFVIASNEVSVTINNKKKILRLTFHLLLNKKIK
jgi:hypothetical protein